MRYVIAADVALRLLAERAGVAPPGRLVAPTLLRSQVLSGLYGAVRAGAFGRGEARARLAHLRGLGVRLLGDRVLMDRAWDVAARLGWADTLQAEYLALTLLQADAFVTLDAELARVAAGVVPVASYARMLAGDGAGDGPRGMD
jgi:predicted nucleic acid-binding protein